MDKLIIIKNTIERPKHIETVEDEKVVLWKEDIEAVKRAISLLSDYAKGMIIVHLKENCMN